MQLRDYLRVARRRWVSILLVTALGGLLGFGISEQVTPQYSSTSRIFISTTPTGSSDAYQGGLFSQQRVASYADVLTGLGFAQRVVDELGLDLDAEELSEKLEVSVVPDTVVLRLSVTDSSRARAQEINQGALDVLQQIVEELETPRGRENPLVQANAVDPPRVTEEPVSPLPLRNTAVGLLVGLLVGYGVAVGRAVLDTTVTSVDDLAGHGDLPLLASLPFASEVPKTPLITDAGTHAPRAEAFRVLATNLSFLDVDRPSKVLAFTSSVPTEGKSTTAVNAAIALAGTGARVLLVDGDLRRPSVGGLLGVEDAVGVTSILVGRATLDDCLQQHAASGLDVLTSGPIPPNPSQLLQSRAMADLVGAVRDRYDLVIVDSPPLLPVTDAALLAAQADGAVLVVRHGRTTRDEVSGALGRLQAVDATPVGVVMTMVRGEGRSGATSYGYEPVVRPRSR